MASHKRRPVRALVTLTVAIVAACAALAIGHFTKGVSPYPDLALDLKGGTQLILTPTVTGDGQREITDDDITQAISIIRNRIDASGVSESEISSMGNSNIMVSIPGTPSQEQLDLIRSSSQMNFRPVLRIGAAQGVIQNQPSQTEAGQSGTQSGEQSGEDSQSGASSSGADHSAQSGGVQSTALDAATAMSTADTDHDGTLSDTPATTPENGSDLAWVTEQVMYDFLTLDCSAAADVKRVEGPSDKPYAACDDSGQIKYILGPVAVPGSDLKTATAGLARNSNGQTTGQWAVSLQFNEAGKEKFKETSTILYGFHGADAAGSSFYRGRPDRNSFAVVLDGTVITAPSMNAIIPTGEAELRAPPPELRGRVRAADFRHDWYRSSHDRPVGGAHRLPPRHRLPHLAVPWPGGHLRRFAAGGLDHHLPRHYTPVVGDGLPALARRRCRPDHGHRCDDRLLHRLLRTRARRGA